mgnify:FL=1
MKTLKALILAAVCSSFLVTTSFADEFGTKEEAAALLERAIALVRVDKNRALDLFTTGEGGLIQKDLYIFCFAPDGTVIAHPNAVGINVFENNLSDLQGNQLGEALFSAAKVGEFGEVTYKLPRPTTGSDQEFTKTGFVTRVAGLVCGVGYYHPE